MGQILKYSDNNDVLFSIHNQETNQENELFTNKSGAFYDWLNNKRKKQHAGKINIY